MGDTVNIRTVPNITIQTYVKGQKLATQTPESPNVTLNINQGRYFQFIVDNVDIMQSDLKLMDDWATDAGEQMKINIDTGILGDIYTSVHAQNKGLTAGRKSASFNLGTTGAPAVVTAANIVEFITALAAVGDEQSWPEQGRWLVIPAWMRYLIMNSDLKNASLAGDDASILRNGRIGIIDRFVTYVSNNVSSVTDGSFTCYNILAGHRSGLTFASQMTEMDTLKSETTFGTIVRGLNVYGYQVIKATSLALLYARKG